MASAFNGRTKVRIELDKRENRWIEKGDEVMILRRDKRVYEILTLDGPMVVPHEFVEEIKHGQSN